MNKVLEIGAYVLASAVALGGGFVFAEVMFSSGNASAGVEAAAERAPPNTAEIRNARYGFSFRYPQGWGQGPRYHPSVRESVGRRDGVFCYVSVMEKPVASDANGRPKDLRRHMAGLRPEHFERVMVMGAKTKVETLEKATLGGQEARSFIVDVKAGAGATMRQGKLIGYATLRHFGAIFLICVAPEGLHADAGVRKDFRTAFTTFAFTGR